MEENKAIDSNLENENVEEVIEEVGAKTFTQDELDKIVNKRLARERKDIEAKIENERKEAEELAKLSEKEKQQKIFDNQVKEFEVTKKAFEREKLLNETSKQLASKSLPFEFADILISEDAEKTFENIKTFETKFNDALEKIVTERLKGKSPNLSTSANKASLTKEDFKKMNMSQRIKLRNDNPTLYVELSTN